MARGLAGLQESLSDCKEPQEGTVLSVLNFYIYMHTHVCVCMCILRNCLIFALYLWQKHNYFIFFLAVPLNRGSLNTGNFFCLFLVVFCMLESCDYKIIVVTVFEVGGTG